MVDFGMDLAAAIIMFEKPMGIWAILEEESLFPKATDKSFEEKLKASLGKLPVFLKPQSKTDPRAHFAISHYAGIVSYNVTNWLEKNKDPVNDTVVEVMKSTSTVPLLVHLWLDHPGQPTETPKEEGRKKKKGGGGKTVSSVYLVSLGQLMETLHNCEPHFVRCLVPNTHKKPGEVEPPLIMHQLTCNGVLEGIRICMRGFPNRMLYPDFKLRYSCLGQDAIKSSSDNKTAVWALMDGIPFDRERYRLGHTLVFFRAGSLGALEEERDKLVIKWVRMIQGEVLKRVRGRVYQKKFDQRELIKVGQRNFRKYLASRDWGWFVLIQKTRGLIGLPNPEEELRLLEEKANATWGQYKEALDVTANLQGSMDGLKAEIEAMGKQLAEEQGNISVYTDRQTKATATKVQAEGELKEAQAVLSLGFLQLTFGLDLGGSGLGLPVGVDRDVALLLSQLLAHGLNFSLEAVHAALEVGGDIKGLLVLSPGGVGLLLQKPELLLRVGQADQTPGLLDEDEPSPVPAGQVLAEVPLADLDQLPLVELLLVDAATDSLEHLTLDHAHPLDHQLVTLLLEGTKGASAEEDKGVSEPVPLTVEGNTVHKSPDGGLVVAGGLDGILTQARVAELEVRVEHPVGESTHADPDALQHTVASQLVHDEGGLHLARLLVGVGHKATHEVGLARVEGGHQLHQGDKVDGRHSLAATLLLLLALVLGGSSGLARVVFPEENQQGVSGLALHDLDHRVVDGVLVLLKPSSDIVGHDTRVVRDGKVGVLVGLGLGLQEDRKLAKGGLEFFLEGLIGGLGEEGLLLQDGPDTHGLLEHDDGSSQVHAEVNHDPVNALANVFLLLNDEHVVVEELLKLLVHKVDGDLLEAVVLEDLEAGNVKHSAEVGLLHGGVNEGVVTLDDEPLEDPVEDGTSNTSSGHGGLLAGLTLSHPLGSDLDPGLAEGLEEGLGVNAKSSSSLARERVQAHIGNLSLVVTALGLVDDATAGHDGSGQHVARELLLDGEAQDVEGVLGVEKLLIVIDGVDLGLTLGDIDVVVDVGRHEALGTETSLADAISIRLEQLVEDVVGPLDLLLLGDTGLLEQVGHDVTTAKLSAGGEVDTDELTEPGGVVVPRGLGVAVGLQDGVGGHNLVLKGDLLGVLLGGTASSGGNHRQVGDHLLGVLGLASTRLTGDQHGVVLLVLEHVPVGALSDGPQLGRALVPPLAQVDLAHPVGVEGVPLVRVDDNHEQARVGVDQLGLVAGLQVPEDGSVVEVGQVDHVLALLELGRVDATDLASLEGELLVADGDGHLHAEVGALHAQLADLSGLKETLLVAVGLGVHDPDGLLGVVGLVLVLLLHVHGGPKELRGVGVHGALHQLDMARHLSGGFSHNAEKQSRLPE